MDPSAYREMAAVETDHWFWLGRRYIIEQTIKGLGMRDARILELGSGSGGNIALLQSHGTLTAVEMELEARLISAERYPDQVVETGYLPDNLPDDLGRFDLICMFDVLEHVGPSKEALTVVAQHLKPGGHLLITVPAHPWLWSDWDELHHHFRRYTRGKLRDDASGGSLTSVKITHFNFVLLPLIATVRFVSRALKVKVGGAHGIPNLFVNKLLFRVLKLEAWIIGAVNMPFGVSILGLFRKEPS